MNEATWNSSGDPTVLLHHLLFQPTGGLRETLLISLRKMRLLTATVLRHVVYRHDPPPSVHQLAAIAELERFADDGNEDGMYEVWQDANLPRPGIALGTVAGTRMHAAMVCEYPMADTRQFACELLRQFVPFRPYVIWPGPKTMEAVKKLARPDSRLNHLHREMLTPQVLSLATAAYENRTELVCERCKGSKKIRKCDNEQLQQDRKRGKYTFFPPMKYEKCDACHGQGRISDGTLDPHRLALVADALEECGCVDAALLGALRNEPQRCTAGCQQYIVGDNTSYTLANPPLVMPLVPCAGCGGAGVRPAGAAYRGAWFLDVLLAKE